MELVNNKLNMLHFLFERKCNTNFIGNAEHKVISEFSENVSNKDKQKRAEVSGLINALFIEGRRIVTTINLNVRRKQKRMRKVIGVCTLFTELLRYTEV